MSGNLIFWVIFGLYIIIGVYCFFWIKSDAEFRAGSWALVAIPALILWPVMLLIWLLIRGKEHLSSIAAKQSHRDYKIYMRSKKEKDLFAYFPQQVTSQKTTDGAAQTRDSSISQPASFGGGFFRDQNIESLIAMGKWDEALKVAKQMRKVAIQTQEEDRMLYYDGCIQRIENGFNMEKE